jgi:hypothetical protein
LTEEVGRALSCYDGAVRVYWPGMSVNDGSRQHPLYLPSVLRKYRESREPWEQVLAERLAGISALRLSQSDLTNRVRRELAEEQRAEAKRKLDQATTGQISMAEMLQELDVALKRIEELEENSRLLHARIEQLVYVQDWQRSAPEGKEGSDVDGKGTTKGFSNVLCAVEAAQRDFSGPLQFLDSAGESARDSPFNRPDDVYALLKDFHHVASRWRKGEGSLGTPWANALAERGVEFKAHISPTTKGMFGSEYMFFYKGETRLFEQHVTLGAKSPDTCLSVHVYRDDDDYVLVVGHVGRHLRNTKT